jgi:spore germination protein GerM
MSRKRKTSRASCITIAVLSVAVAALGIALWRIYPEYRRLRARAEAEPPPPVAAREAEHPMVVRLYFTRVVEGKQRMVPISRELPVGLTPARAALEELIRGEVPRGCERPLPQGTKVRSVTVSDGLATVDLSDEFRTGFRGGSDNEGVTVYSVVNTLTSLPHVERVQILVGGERVNTIGGHLVLGEPLGFDDELVVSYP